MMQIHWMQVGRVAGHALLLAATFCVAGIVHAEATATESKSSARLDFEAANLPEASVEVDLSQEMFRDLFGIGDAVIAGIAEAVSNSTDGGSDAAKHMKLTAEQLSAAREIAELAGMVVREVRVRAYQSLPEEINDAQQLFKPFDAQLREAKWETIVRVREDEQIARVSVLRRDGAIQGVFVVATDGDSAVIANVLCDISPENVKKLAAAATKIGLKANFRPKFEINTSFVPGETETHTKIVIQNAAPAAPPVPPTSPNPPSPLKK